MNLHEKIAHYDSQLQALQETFFQMYYEVVELLYVVDIDPESHNMPDTIVGGWKSTGAVRFNAEEFESDNGDTWGAVDYLDIALRYIDLAEKYSSMREADQPLSKYDRISLAVMFHRMIQCQRTWIRVFMEQRDVKIMTDSDDASHVSIDVSMMDKAEEVEAFVLRRTGVSKAWKSLGYWDEDSSMWYWLPHQNVLAQVVINMFEEGVFGKMCNDNYNSLPTTIIIP